MKIDRRLQPLRAIPTASAPACSRPGSSISPCRKQSSGNCRPSYRKTASAHRRSRRRGSARRAPCGRGWCPGADDRRPGWAAWTPADCRPPSWPCAKANQERSAGAHRPVAAALQHDPTAQCLGLPAPEARQPRAFASATAQQTHGAGLLESKTIT